MDSTQFTIPTDVLPQKSLLTKEREQSTSPVCMYCKITKGLTTLHVKHYIAFVRTYVVEVGFSQVLYPGEKLYTQGRHFKSSSENLSAVVSSPGLKFNTNVRNLCGYVGERATSGIGRL
jgi:hypothetical protein